jgi:histidinol phosphatase-like PHP family hydrolase
MKFCDYHCHTSLSYCVEEAIAPADYARAIEREGALLRAAITNHGFAIYFPEDVAWSWRFMSEPSLFDERINWGNRRFIPHLEEVEALRDKGLLTGVEVEMMKDGRLTVDPELMDRLDVIVGSVHWLPVERNESPIEIVDVWMRHTRRLVQAGIHVLGHPLRWLESRVKQVPGEIVPFVVDAALEAGVAVEINSHFVVEAESDILREAVRRGAAVTFSADAHRLCEIGKFEYHLSLVERSGLRLDDVKLWAPSPASEASP